MQKPWHEARWLKILLVNVFVFTLACISIFTTDKEANMDIFEKTLEFFFMEASFLLGKHVVDKEK